MQIFACPKCGATAYFANLKCVCGADLTFDPAAQVFVTDADPCANRPSIRCNWTGQSETGLCRSCAMTEVIPDTFYDENRALWARAELSKRWVLANLARWGWFAETDGGPPPRFHLLSESGAPVVMGHEDGLVTINLAEADPVEMVRRREINAERLRTMTGHFRHELAHFLFERSTAATKFLDEFRSVFGDERADYGAALEAHYSNGPPADWSKTFVTPYASCHPHEDWAESVAHVLHLTDILDSAIAVNLRSDDVSNRNYDPYQERDAKALISAAVEYGLAINHVNRSMGLSDIYPFVHSPAVRAKLAFAHRWIAII